MLSLNLFHSYVTYLYIPLSWSKYLLFPRYNGAKTNSQKYRSQSRHRREKKIRIPKTSTLLSSDPDPISLLSEFIKNIEYLESGSTSLSPLEIHFARDCRG